MTVFIELLNWLTKIVVHRFVDVKVVLLDTTRRLTVGDASLSVVEAFGNRFVVARVPVFGLGMRKGIVERRVIVLGTGKSNSPLFICFDIRGVDLVRTVCGLCFGVFFALFVGKFPVVLSAAALLTAA